MSTNIEMMSPQLKEKYILFKSETEKKGIFFDITSVDRNIIEQMALFVQGRLPIETVNSFRHHAGLPAISSNNVVVTWTLNSKHIVNEKLGIKYSRAFDIILKCKKGKRTYDIKVDVNNNKISDYYEVGQIWKKLGGKWGGDFKNPDRPHFEI